MMQNIKFCPLDDLSHLSHYALCEERENQVIVLGTQPKIAPRAIIFGRNYPFKKGKLTVILTAFRKQVWIWSSRRMKSNGGAFCPHFGLVGDERNWFGGVSKAGDARNLTVPVPRSAKCKIGFLGAPLHMDERIAACAALERGGKDRVSSAVSILGL